MSRLLFAAARGARIQYQHDGKWYVYIAGLPILADDVSISRIHPDDEHLQYGPISSALREAAKAPPGLLFEIEGPAQWHAIDWKRGDRSPYRAASKSKRSAYLYFLAEALADEGL